MKKIPGVLFLTVFAVAWLAGCGPSDSEALAPLSIPAGCNPLAADWDCLLPYPSDVFLVDDASLPSGRRVALAERAWVRDQAHDAPIDPFVLGPVDGFSHLPLILAVFPAGVDASSLVFFDDDLARVLGGDSPTVILDALTGQPVLHFAELNPRADDPARQALMLRPLVRLENQRRYVVAISGLRDPGGGLIEPPEGFRRLRDRKTAGDPVLADLAERYEREVFEPLAAAGIDRAGLQLAWDLTTGSMERSAADLLEVREQTLAWLAEHQPRIQLDERFEPPDGPLALRVEGRFQVPLFMETAEPGARLNRDSGNRPSLDGLADANFTLVVPRSLAERPAEAPAGRLIQFSHGFFGSRTQITDGWLVEFADRYGFVLLATDWWGMSEQDTWPLIDAMLTRPADTLVFAERVLQGMANFLVLGDLAGHGLAELAELRPSGRPAYQPEHLYLLGISQGHILGATYLTISPRIDRAVLCVGGAGFSLMMSRARPFGPFLGMLETLIPDPLEIQKFIALLQSGLDRIDPGTYAGHTLTDTYSPGPPERKVLMEVGMVDTQVPNLATQLHARILGLGLLQPAPQSVFGLEPVESPTAGSALVDHDFGLDPATVAQAEPAPEDNGVHREVPRLAATQAQIDEFLRTNGQIVHSCAGICDPE